MTGASLHVARTLARRFPWADYRTFVDIGTAEGAVPVAIALAHPHLAGGGFDLPSVRPVFDAYVQQHVLGDRLRFYAGDFFKEPLPSADVL
jgi:O-methyltransferase domain